MSACGSCNDLDQWPPRLIVTLVDETEHCGTVEDWAKLPADRISRIDVARQQLGGHSFYWLYEDQLTRDERVWVAGGFSIFEYDAAEYIIRENGEVFVRRVKSIPDLQHEQVKLGWWWKQ